MMFEIWPSECVFWPSDVLPNVLMFSHSKSMETIDPGGEAKFDPRGMNGTIYKEDHKPLPHTKYQSCGPSGFREEDFFSFSHCKSMRAIRCYGNHNFDTICSKT